MIYLEERHQKIIQDILKKYPYTFYVFGSRTKGSQKHFSDLDLCFNDAIPMNIQAHIDEDFEESDLPFKVDLMDWNLMAPEFKEIIKNDLVLLQKGPHFRQVK